MADLTGNITEAGQQYQDKLSTVGVRAVVSQSVLMTVVSLGAVLVFNFLRPRNNVVYSPKEFFVGEDKRLPGPGRGCFSWLPALWSIKEDEIVEKLGLDAALFLRFLRLLRTLFLLTSVVSLGCLLPINLTYNRKFVAQDQRNELSQLTVADVRGRWLWGAIAVAYIFNFFAMVLIWWNWREVLERRTEFFVTPYFINSLHTRCLLVTHVPDTVRSDEDLTRLIEQLDLPRKPLRISLGHEIGDLPDKIDNQHQAVQKLEKALLKYLKQDKLGDRRPTTRPGAWWKLWEKKVDAIDLWTEKVKESEDDIKEERKRSGKVESYGFVSFPSAAHAQDVSAKLKGTHPSAGGIKILNAPDPRDIIWSNVGRSRGEVAGMKIALSFLLALVVLWYTIPVALVSVVANLATMSQYVGFLKKWQQADEWSFSFVSGIISPILAGIFAVLLPIALRTLSKYQGAYSLASLELVVLKRLYTLFILSQFFVFSILSVVLQLIANAIKSVEEVDSGPLVDSLKELPAAISSSYLAQANFWLTWLPMRGFLAFYDLANLIKLLLVASAFFFNQTPRAIRKRSEPPRFKYSQVYASLLLISAVGLIYAPLAPLVPAFAAVAITIASATYKFQLCYIYSNEIETGGSAWPVVIDRLLLNVGLMNLSLVLTVSLQNRQVAPSCISAIPILALFIFWLTIIRRNKRRFDEYPLARDAEDLVPQPDPNEPDDADVPLPKRRRTFRMNLSPLERLGKPLDGILSTLDGSSSDAPDGSDNRANPVVNLRKRLRGRAPLNDLDRRFGHPALDAPLWTTMVFAEQDRLLPRVYERRDVWPVRVEVSELGGRKRRADKVGGIAIVPVQEEDMEVVAQASDGEGAAGRPHEQYGTTQA